MDISIVYSKLKGIEKFQGKVFHSAQWDVKHDFTNQRVALIGSGASAVQIAPAIGKVQLWSYLLTSNILRNKFVMLAFTGLGLLLKFLYTAFP